MQDILADRDRMQIRNPGAGLQVRLNVIAELQSQVRLEESDMPAPADAAITDIGPAQILNHAANMSAAPNTLPSIDPILPDKNAMLQPFTTPGLGFTINERLLRKYGKRFFKLTETGLKIKVIREKGLKAALALKKRKEQ